MPQDNVIINFQCEPFFIPSDLFTKENVFQKTEDAEFEVVEDKPLHLSFDFNNSSKTVGVVCKDGTIEAGTDWDAGILSEAEIRGLTQL